MPSGCTACFIASDASNLLSASPGSEQRIADTCAMDCVVASLTQLASYQRCLILAWLAQIRQSKPQCSQQRQWAFCSPTARARSQPRRHKQRAAPLGPSLRSGRLPAAPRREPLHSAQRGDAQANTLGLSVSIPKPLLQPRAHRAGGLVGRTQPPAAAVQRPRLTCHNSQRIHPLP